MYDCVVIGSGFGGLSTAFRLAEENKKVLLCESLKYPGGCASTFEKKGLAFEAGATLFSGFGEEQLFAKWKTKYKLPVEFMPLSPTVLFRCDGISISVFPNREKTIAQFCSLPNAPVESIHQFFAYQKKIADILWPVFDDPRRLPPFSIHGLWWHFMRSWRYFSLLPIMNTPLIKVLQKYNLHEFQPLLQYCNALCQITIQTNIYNAESPFALCTMDYIFRGTGHIQGGIGTLAKAMVTQIEQMGGTVQMPGRVKRLEKSAEGWNVYIRKEKIKTRTIVANLLPAGLEKLLPELPLPIVERELQNSVEKGWGAVMLYLIIKDNPSLPRHPHHIQCVGDPSAPFQNGNHIFCSLGGAGENIDPERRTATVSTHISIEEYTNHSNVAVQIATIQEKMKQLIHEKIPELVPYILEYIPGSPRTFARFTSRKEGCVGGIPRQVGWHNYKGLWPRQVHPNLWLVGDSVFPGQSTLSTAVGGARTANEVLRWLP